MGRTPSEAVWARVGGIGLMRVNEEIKYPAATPSSALPDGPAPLIRIEAAKAWPSLRLGELWAYRELIYFLIWRDIKVRYKQTVLGAGWAIVQPLFTMLLFSLFFGRLARVPSDGIPYPLFSFTGLVPWSYFANGLTQASNSLVGNSSLIKKVYFRPTRSPIRPNTRAPNGRTRKPAANASSAKMLRVDSGN